MSMEDIREANFRKIQQILDRCVAREYGMKTSALALKREYLTEEQMRDHIRQEIFNTTESIVSLCQQNRALHNIRSDIQMPDFLWESGFFENLSFDGRKKYISFQCSSFNIDEYLQSPTCYDEQLPFFSSLVRFVVQTQYLEYLQQLENKYAATSVPSTEQEEQPKEEEKAQPGPTKIVGKSNPFKSVLTTQQIKLLVECINEAHIFTTTITPKILSDFFACKLNGVLKSNNNRLLAYLMMQLSCYNYIAYEWQSVIANNKLVLAKIKDKYLTRSDLSSATDNVKCIYPKGYEIIDKYIKQLQKG